MHKPTKIEDRPPEIHKNAEKNPCRLGGWVAAALLILLVFAGCDNTFSVFQTIAQEERQIGEDLFKNTTIRAMADDSTNYYALLSQVVWRPKSGGNWNVLAIAGSTDYFAAGLAGDGTKLYVAKANDNNGLEDIYTTNNSGTSWTAMGAATVVSSGGIGTDAFVDWLKYTKDTLFVAVHDSARKYSLFYYDGVSSKFASTGVSDIDEPLIDIVYDGSSQYWLISDSKVYKGAPGSIAEDTTAPNNPNYDGYLLGIASDGAGRVIVSRRDGSVYSYTSSAWSPITVKVLHRARVGLLPQSAHIQQAHSHRQGHLPLRLHGVRRVLLYAQGERQQLRFHVVEHLLHHDTLQGGAGILAAHCRIRCDKKNTLRPPRVGQHGHVCAVSK